MRFGVDKFDWQTYVVNDYVSNGEVCICGHFEKQLAPPKIRAGVIAHLLNQLDEGEYEALIRPLLAVYKAEEAAKEAANEAGEEAYNKTRSGQVADAAGEKAYQETLDSFASSGDSYWGLCPSCRQPGDRYLNVEATHYYVCDDCRTYWAIGANLFSSWKSEPAEVWETNAALLDTYQEVKPIYPDLTPSA